MAVIFRPPTQGTEMRGTRDTHLLRENSLYFLWHPGQKCLM